MRHAGARFIAVGLAIGLLVLSGLMYPQTVAHAAHHAHHKAATHSTALCTWMCTAGQAQETVSLTLNVAPQPVHLASDYNFRPPVDAHFTAPATRGPPSRLF